MGLFTTTTPPAPPADPVADFATRYQQRVAAARDALEALGRLLASPPTTAEAGSLDSLIALRGMLGLPTAEVTDSSYAARGSLAWILEIGDRLGRHAVRLAETTGPMLDRLAKSGTCPTLLSTDDPMARPAMLGRPWPSGSGMLLSVVPEYLSPHHPARQWLLSRFLPAQRIHPDGAIIVALAPSSWVFLDEAQIRSLTGDFIAKQARHDAEVAHRAAAEKVGRMTPEEHRISELEAKVAELQARIV